MALTSEQVLMVFLKYPKPGRVKTRLAASVGSEKAAALYQRMAEYVVAQTDSTRYCPFLLVEPSEKLTDFQRWLGKDKHYIPQSPGGLGEKLLQAFTHFFEGGAQSVIAIGSDCLDLQEKDILNAFQQLGPSDVVIGPAVDGGYYLIGFTRRVYQLLKADLSSLFNDMDWSTPSVYSQTEERLQRCNLNISTLSVKRDIDTIDDLDAFGELTCFL